MSAALKEKLAAKIPPMRETVKQLIAEHGERSISEVSVAQAYGGMRGVKSMVTETSALDPDEGIRFRGYSIPEVQRALPRPPGAEQVLPEGLFYLLLTGEIPTLEEVNEITATWRANEQLPEFVKTTLEGMPTDTHPMTQFSMGILALQRESIFARAYREGTPKAELWERCSTTRCCCSAACRCSPHMSTAAATRMVCTLRRIVPRSTGRPTWRTCWASSTRSSAS